MLVLDAEFFRRWMSAAAAAVDREAGRLTELDSAIGDADHGSNLQRGFAAVAAVLDKEQPAAPGAVLALAGRQLISTVGGASGPLYGTLLRRTGKALGDEAEVTPERLAEALRAGRRRGGAAGRGEGRGQDDAGRADPGGRRARRVAVVRRGADGGGRGGARDRTLQARKGRASYLGERSIGHQDPGATSSALLIGALADTADSTEGAA